MGSFMMQRIITLELKAQIIDAIRRRDTEAAQKLMQEHLQVTMDMLRDN